jgi:hypothetical protein
MNSAILAFTQNKSRLFLIFIVVFLVACFTVIPFLGLLIISLLINERLKSKPLKMILLGIGIALATLLTYSFILSYFNPSPGITNNYFYGTLYWAAEASHFLILMNFIYQFYRIFRYSNTPYSFFYVGMYNFVHAIYKACPVTQLQNYLALGTTNITPVANTYWRGAFGEYSEYLRMGFLTLSIVFLYRAYIEYMRFDIPVKDWLSSWKEGKYEDSPAVARYDTKQAH